MEIVSNMKKTSDNENMTITQEDANKLQDLLNSRLSKDPKSTAEHNNSTISKKPDKNAAIMSKSITIRCRVCNKTFTLSPSELKFYENKGFQLPQRCKDCRDKGIMYSNDDYYDRGLKRNSYQSNLEMYGPRINVSGGMDYSPGYFPTEAQDGKTAYVRKFDSNIETVKFDHFKHSFWNR